MPEVRQVADTTFDPPVRGFLHSPESANSSGLILTHGAGGNAQAPLLIALAETFSSAGFMVLRINLPYRQSRFLGPPRPADAARDRAGIKNAIGALCKIEDVQGKSKSPPSRTGRDKDGTPPGRKIFLGGHSYGGRQCSMLCAELSKEGPSKDESGLVSALLLCSYPLHPPGKPEQRRTRHLPGIRIPTLFVHGTRDPFGSVDEMEQAIKLIPAETKLLIVENAGHDLGFKGKSRREELPGMVFREFSQLLGL